MSLDDYRGEAWAYRELMRSVQAEIDKGERKGAKRLWRTAHPKKTAIGWFERRVLRGEFKLLRSGKG